MLVFLSWSLKVDFVVYCNGRKGNNWSISLHCGKLKADLLNLRMGRICSYATKSVFMIEWLIDTKKSKRIWFFQRGDEKNNTWTIIIIIIDFVNSFFFHVTLHLYLCSVLAVLPLIHQSLQLCSSYLPQPINKRILTK